LDVPAVFLPIDDPLFLVVDEFFVDVFVEADLVELPEFLEAVPAFLADFFAVFSMCQNLMVRKKLFVDARYEKYIHR